MKKILFIILISCCFNTAYSQDEVVADTAITYEEYEAEDSDEAEDSKNRVYERKYMDKSSLQTLRSKKEFRYPDLDNDTLELQKKDPAPSSSGFQGFDVSLLLWLIVAIAAVLVILQLIGVNMRQLFNPARISSSTESELENDNIHEISFEQAIAQAIESKDFSRATRLLYLQSLKLLSDKNLIAWHENKTNWQYVYEIKTWELRDQFKYLTSVFEFVHYGHMQIDENRFRQVFTLFQNFKTALA